MRWSDSASRCANGGRCATCGGRGDPCCTITDDAGTSVYCTSFDVACVRDKCVPCGALKQPCCQPNDWCSPGLRCNAPGSDTGTCI